mmetsp:Transcript_60474/g.128188  ORF Transcript_60474/g.128188 Transcript_60474/m.128188 type:complete len:384 (-) Transcript_60474:75-1226(-)
MDLNAMNAPLRTAPGSSLNASLLSVCWPTFSLGQEWLFSGCKDTAAFLKDLDRTCGASWDKKEHRRPRKAASAPAGPPLALRIVHVPDVKGTGACLGPFGLEDDVAITAFEPCKGFAPMMRRQGLESSTSSRSRNPLYPRSGDRFTTPHNFYRARVCVSDNNNGFEEYWCLLSVSSNPAGRTLEPVEAAIKDSVTTANYAQQYNSFIRKIRAEHLGADPDDDSMGVRVCIPVAAVVLAGRSDVAEQGEVLSLSLYPFKSVEKFVFDGAEPFIEIPQAFFHFVHHTSEGREVVADIQGIEDEDGDFYLVDPVVLRRTQPSVGALLGAVLADKDVSSLEVGRGDEKLRFDTWHPRCGQLCHIFDPARKSANCRRACGLPMCGVGM